MKPNLTINVGGLGGNVRRKTVNHNGADNVQDKEGGEGLLKSGRNDKLRAEPNSA